MSAGISQNGFHSVFVPPDWKMWPGLVNWLVSGFALAGATYYGCPLLLSDDADRLSRPEPDTD
jgi:hypothetical protein